MEDLQIVVGRNAVFEAIAAGRGVESLLIQTGERRGYILKIIAAAKERGIPVKEAAREKLDGLSGEASHQGVVLILSAYRYAEIEEPFALARERGEFPLLVVLDEIADPHNLGAIIRTAEAVGAHGVIIPKRRAAGLTPVAAKAACGALEYLPVVRVTNLAAALEYLKKQNLFIYGADMAGGDYTKRDYTVGTAIVIGSEGSGLRRLIKEKCDEIISLPMPGRMESLNASVACGVLIYEAVRQRHLL
ncbi:MAG TPA: 23S rRNA (guanosine(2251)-2'-O)-methyltransferase RlmB [Ruminococcaceae bacterium]|nr:23S rRNA (guanosine(2251)-2'-O)-methyltransferase RlmB [Oscillospiraceae bacterium]